MSRLSRSLLRSTLLAVALLPCIVSAEEAADRLRDISREAGEVLQLMSKQLRELQYRSMSSDAAAAGGGRVFSGGSYTIMDLQRNAQRLAGLASEANSRAAKCDKEVRNVARDFQSQARRINTATNRLANAREQSATTLTLDQIDFALQRAYSLVPSIGAITECSTATDEETGGDEQDEEDRKKKEDEKGTEDYDE